MTKKIPRMLSKTARFGMLYGNSSINGFNLMELSSVERLGALVDPVLADRVLFHDHLAVWAAKQLGDMGGLVAALQREELTTRPARSTSPSGPRPQASPSSSITSPAPTTPSPSSATS